MGAEKVDAFSKAGMALSTGAVPLMTATTMQAWRTGFDVFNALTRVAASRTIPQTMGARRWSAMSSR